MQSLEVVCTWFDAHALWLFLMGLVVIVAWNWRTSRKDLTLAYRRSESKLELLELNATPKVSVLVAAWNEVNIIGEHVESFLRLRYRNKELILCAGGDDATYETARQYAGEQVVVLEQRVGEGKQRALQRCLKRATGGIVFLTDADCVLDDGSFDQALLPLVENDEEVVTGGFRPLRAQMDNPFVVYQWAIDRFVAERRPPYVGGLQGRNSALTWQALEEAGGFVEEVLTGTDYFLAKKLLRAGYRIRYAAGSVIQTRYPEDVRTYVRKRSRWVRNLLVHGPHFGAWEDVRAALRTTFLGLGMLAWPLTFPWSRRWGVGLWLVALGYALLARGRYVSLAGRANGQRLRLQVYLRLPLYMFIDFLAWTHALVDYVIPARRNRW